jgi:hypothetical protein
MLSYTYSMLEAFQLLLSFFASHTEWYNKYLGHPTLVRICVFGEGRFLLGKIAFAKMLTRRFPHSDLAPRFILGRIKRIRCQSTCLGGRVSYPPAGGIVHKSIKRQSFSSRLASASVCFISFKRASATRSGFDRLQLLTIHSFMNHEFMWATSITLTGPFHSYHYRDPPPHSHSHHHILSLTCP